MNARQALWAGIGLLSIQLTTTSMQACQGPEDPALMPAAGGALRDLGIQFSRQDGQRFLHVYEQIFAELDPQVTVHVVVSDTQDRDVFEQARRSWHQPGPQVSYLSVDRPITSWMRDRLAVLEGPVLLAPPAPMVGPEPRVNDWFVPWIVVEKGSISPTPIVQIASFQFEGGDLIANEQHIFIAPPLLQRNPERDAEDVLDDVARETGLHVVRLGADTPVPDHHIGMFVTPLADGRVAYGDPDLAIQTLGRPDAVWSDGQRIDLDLSEERLERFRQVGRDLRAAGFETVALPILPAAAPYVLFSYNNALLEHRDRQLHVYMPSYGVKALDDAAIEAWTDAGAVVHPIDVAGVFQLGGSVRCLTAPLVRG